MNDLNSCQLPLPIQLSDFDLIYGIGNVGREDDGLGWAFVDHFEAKSANCASQEYIRHYQLFFEDVALLQNCKRVLFIDACQKGSMVPEDLENGFVIEKIQPQMDFSFTSHSISLPSIAAMSHICYQNCPDIWLISIQGYQWELKIGLSPKASSNLESAIRFVAECGVQPFGTSVWKLLSKPEIGLGMHEQNYVDSAKITAPI